MCDRRGVVLYTLQLRVSCCCSSSGGCCPRGSVDQEEPKARDPSSFLLVALSRLELGLETPTTSPDHSALTAGVAKIHS